jgi:hypothetical protein
MNVMESVGFVGIGILLDVFKAWIAVWLWTWFILPFTGIASPSVVIMFGISLFIGSLWVNIQHQIQRSLRIIRLGIV